jgi:beta-xylosidase
MMELCYQVALLFLSLRIKDFGCGFFLYMSQHLRHDLKANFSKAPDVSLIGDTYYAYYAVSFSGYVKNSPCFPFILGTKVLGNSSRNYARVARPIFQRKRRFSSSRLILGSQSFGVKLYWLVNRSQASDIGVATSSSLAYGTWTDHGSLEIPKSTAYNLIDPNFFVQCTTCQNYFSFGSAWDMIYQTELATSYTTWSGETPSQIAFNGTGGTFEEGSFQFWWPVDGVDYFYLFFSSGACCNTPPNLAPAGDEYKIMVCRATSATGPFTDQTGRNCRTGEGGTLVLGTHGTEVYAPGGQGVIVDPDSGLIALYYHYGMFDLDLEFEGNSRLNVDS